MRNSSWHFRTTIAGLLVLFFAFHGQVPKGIILSQAPYFLLGIGVAFHLFGKTQRLELGLLSLPILMAIHSMQSFGFWVALVTLLVILTFPRFNPRPLQLLGRQSYSLYLIHGTVGTSTVNLLMNGCDDPWQKLALVLFATAASITAAEVLYRVVEAPSHRWSKRVELH